MHRVVLAIVLLLGACAGELPEPAKPLATDAAATHDHATDAARPDAASDASSASGCDLEEELYRGHCYRAVVGLPMTYATAREVCANQRAPMLPVAITSEEENAFVFSLLPPFNQATWIGLRRQSPGSPIFVWESGEPLGYARWGTGEPSDTDGIEDCAVIWGPGLPTVEERSRWNDADCDGQPDIVVCERPL